MNRPLILIGVCEGCGRPDGVWQAHHEMMYCPVCAAKNDDYSQATVLLASLLRPVVSAWRHHWIARGTTPKLLLEIVENTDLLEDLVQALNTKAEAAPEEARS